MRPTRFVLMVSLTWAALGCERTSRTATVPAPASAPQETAAAATAGSDPQVLPTPERISSAEPAAPALEGPPPPATSPNPAATTPEAGGPAAGPPAAGADSALAAATAPNPGADATVAHPDVATPRKDPAEQIPPERIVLLTPGGPLVVDVRVKFGGAPIGDALERLVDEAWHTADDDGDGIATWIDVANDPRFTSGQYGNLAASTDEERNQLIRIYDADRDGLVDREELPRFLTRNAGGGRSFSLRSSNEFRGTNRRRSLVRLLLDQDHDGAADRDEMQAATQLLAGRDGDDDEVLVLGELRDTPALDMLTPPATMSNRRRITEPDTAIWLSASDEDLSIRWAMVQFQMQELYSYGDPVTESDWPQSQALFQTLDTNRDNQLDKAEYAGLQNAEAAVAIDVEFDREDAQDPRPQLTLTHVSNDLRARQPRIEESPARTAIQLPSVEVEFWVNEDPSLTRIVETAQAQFQTFDRDRNGYLDMNELPMPAAAGLDVSFAALDADGDGQVRQNDWTDYLRRRSLVTRAQVRARAADHEDALFAALDTDGDGRLSAREIRRSPQCLQELDRNGDGRLLSEEIPGSMVVAFVRGDPRQDDQLLAGSPPVRQSTPEAPRWFVGMDGNADGEVSAREFLGAVHHFERLDTNHDGYLSLAEAGSVDSAPAEKANVVSSESDKQR
ncbi:MAG: hypothetical protein AB7F89_12985 [Pirellulaceae bacterium]